MIYVICGIAFIIAFLFFTRKYRNVWKLYMIFGKKGSGKSTYLIRQGLRYHKKGYTIYTNMQDCMIPGALLFDVEKLGDYVPESDSVLLLDEVGMIWDSRDFKKFKPSVRDFFKLQRHYHVICFLASQTFDIDKKLRDLCDSMILFVNLFQVFSLGRPISKHIVLTEATSDSESRISENLKFQPIWNWKLIYIPKFAPFFNSYHVPDMPKLPYTVVEGEPVEITSPIVERFKSKLAEGQQEYIEDTDPIDRETDKMYSLAIGIAASFVAAGAMCFIYFL